MRSLISSVSEWLSELLAERSDLGLTQQQTDQLISLARTGEEGRDHAERVACSGYGITTDQFVELLSRHGLPYFSMPMRCPRRRQSQQSCLR
jgi:hypothetical protein